MNDGGPAFPFVPGSQPKLDDGTWDQSWESGDSGMSLRDYFAANAPAEPWYYYKPVFDEPKPEDVVDLVMWNKRYQDEYDQQWPWYYADVMIARREKTK